MKKGKMFLGLVAALAFVLIAIPAMATTINWSDGIAHGNQGLTLIPNGDSTITAKSSLGDLDDPLWDRYSRHCRDGLLGQTGQTRC